MPSLINLHEDRVYFFSMIADDVRHAILEYLLTHEKASVSELITQLGKPQTLVSYHLRCLRDCGLVSVRRPPSDRRKRVYYLHDAHMTRTLFSRVDEYLSMLEEKAISSQHAYFGSTTRTTPRQQFFTMVADDVRHAIVDYLLEKQEASVSDLLTVTKRPQTLVSYHLRCLKDCGMVMLEKDDADKRKRKYRLRAPHLIKTIFSLADDFLKQHEICKEYPTCKIRPKPVTVLEENPSPQ